jgi:hypothetical protein
VFRPPVSTLRSRINAPISVARASDKNAFITPIVGSLVNSGLHLERTHANGTRLIIKKWHSGVAAE